MTLPLLRRPLDVDDDPANRERSTAPTRWLQRPVRARHADRDLGALLGRELDALGDVLHDVSFAPCVAPVDHIVIASSGIWLVDSMQLSGRIENGHRRSAESRFVLDGVDRTDLVDELGILRHARGRIRTTGVGDIEIHRVVCIIDGAWPLMARPFQVGDVWITWPRALIEKIRSSGLVPIARAREIGAAMRAGVHDRG